MLDTRPCGVTILRILLDCEYDSHPSYSGIDICTARRRRLICPAVPSVGGLCASLLIGCVILLASIPTPQRVVPLSPGGIMLSYARNHGLPLLRAPPARRWRREGLARRPPPTLYLYHYGGGGGGDDWGLRASTEHMRLSRMALAPLARFFPPRPGARGKKRVLDRRISTLAARGLSSPDRRARGNLRRAVSSHLRWLRNLAPAPYRSTFFQRGRGCSFAPAALHLLISAGRGARIAINRAYLSRFGARCAKTSRRNHPPPLSGVAGGILRGGSPLYALTILPRQATSPPTGRRVVPHGGGRRGDE